MRRTSASSPTSNSKSSSVRRRCAHTRARAKPAQRASPLICPARPLADVNDLDEACVADYSHDLLRLSASLSLEALQAKHGSPRLASKVARRLAEAYLDGLRFMAGPSRVRARSGVRDGQIDFFVGSDALQRFGGRAITELLEKTTRWYPNAAAANARLLSRVRGTCVRRR
jgi:uncharacterized protein (DUF2252 family)